MSQEFQQISNLWLRLLDHTITQPELNELERLLCSAPGAMEYSANFLMELHLLRNDCKQILGHETVPVHFSESFDRLVWEQLAKDEMEAPPGRCRRTSCA